MNNKRKITGRDLLRELDLPAYTDVDFIEKSQAFFGNAMQNLTEHYEKVASGRVENGHQGFAIRFLFARCINDLAVGHHLVTHGYIAQSYSVTRSILESVDKIELFGRDKSYAEIWVNEPGKSREELKPSKVRKLLGKASYDELYGHFCEMGSHPTFTSAQMMSYKEIKTDGSRRIIVKTGPTDFLYPIVFSLGFCYLLIMTVSISLVRHLKGADLDSSDFLVNQLNQIDLFMNESAQPTFLKNSKTTETGLEPFIEEIKKYKKMFSKT